MRIGLTLPPVELITRCDTHVAGELRRQLDLPLRAHSTRPVWLRHGLRLRAVYNTPHDLPLLNEEVDSVGLKC